MRVIYLEHTERWTRNDCSRSLNLICLKGKRIDWNFVAKVLNRQNRPLVGFLCQCRWTNGRLHKPFIYIGFHWSIPITLFKALVYYQHRTSRQMVYQQHHSWLTVLTASLSIKRLCSKGLCFLCFVSRLTSTCYSSQSWLTATFLPNLWHPPTWVPFHTPAAGQCRLE